jgi:hypothetical protein
MKRNFFALPFTLFLLSFSVAQGFRQRQITVINKTGENISIFSLNKPLYPEDVVENWLDRLTPGQRINHLLRGPILGWWQRGKGVNFTVVDRYDSTIVFIKNNGGIKTLHGALKAFDVSNTRSNDIILYTKNPNAGDEDCAYCADECYEDGGNLNYCDCLESCWDHTRDLSWRIEPGQTRTLRAAKGTRVGVVEDESYDAYGCDDEECYQTLTPVRYVYP